jgi:hypothetical protein
MSQGLVSLLFSQEMAGSRSKGGLSNTMDQRLASGVYYPGHRHSKMRLLPVSVSIVDQGSYAETYMSVVWSNN